MTEEKEYSGSMTAMDGTRVMLTPEQAKAMWEDCERIDDERAKTYPDSLSCLRAMSSAEERLKQLGWRDGRYCPRDGSTFAVCEAGSTGMWKGFWSPDSGSEAFPQGYIIAADCVHRPSEMYFKPIDKLTGEEAVLMAKCDADVAVMIEEAGKMLEALTLSEDGSAT